MTGFSPHDYERKFFIGVDPAIHRPGDGLRLWLVPSVESFAPKRYEGRAPRCLEATLRAFQPKRY